MATNFCSACGGALDDDGICTNQKCVRRLLQILLKQKESAKNQAQIEQEDDQKSALSDARENYELNDISKIQKIGLQ